MWLMLSFCDGRESGAALRMPTFPPVQFRHLQRAIESSFLTSIPWSAFLQVADNVSWMWALIQYTKEIKNMRDVDHVRRARDWAAVDEHQLPPRHKYWGSDKLVRSSATRGVFDLCSVNANVLYARTYVRILGQPFSSEPIWTLLLEILATPL